MQTQTIEQPDLAEIETERRRLQAEIDRLDREIKIVLAVLKDNLEILGACYAKRQQRPS